MFESIRIRQQAQGHDIPYSHQSPDNRAFSGRGRRYLQSTFSNNTYATKKALAKLGVPIIASDTGLNYGRTVSFNAGLKTAVLTYLQKEQQAGREWNMPDIAASFQQAVIDVHTSTRSAISCSSSTTKILSAICLFPSFVCLFDNCLKYIRSTADSAVYENFHGAFHCIRNPA